MNVVVASNEADTEAVEKIRAHHAELAGALAVRVGAVDTAARQGADVSAARAELVRWARAELLPHALAEESSVYAAAGGLAEGRLLVEALVADHVVLTGLVEALAKAEEPVETVAAAAALQTLFAAHVDKENEQVLPLLAARPEVSLSELLAGMHQELGGHEEDRAESAGGCGGDCGCGEQDAEVDVELDARAVPHAIRHSTIFGALDGLPQGKTMVLVAPHDPLPLLAQLEQRSPGVFEVGYAERGPEKWRLRFRRRAATPAAPTG